MLRVLFPLVILIAVILLLLPALPPEQTLLPGRYLAFMHPWKSYMEPTSHQWNPLMWDALAQFLPWRTLYHQALHAGQLPLWNPYQFCGTPQYANSQSAVFYPLNLIFYAVEPTRALVFSALFHLFLAGLFTYLLGRSLRFSAAGATTSGLVYALCAFNVTWLELPTLVNVATWLPLILLLSRQAIVKRSVYAAVAAGAAVAMALLAGHLQIAFYVILASAAWCLWLAANEYTSDRRTIAGSAGIVAIILLVGVSLAAVQLIPSAELGRLSHRAGNPTVEGYHGYVAYALPKINLVTAFVPDFFGNPSKGTYWGLGNYAEYAMYVGILPLALAVASFVFYRRRETYFFGVLAVLALLFALGGPLNAIFYFMVPGFSATGSPGRILVLYCFSMSMLAGMGATAFTTQWRDVGPQRRAKRLIYTLAVMAFISVAFLVTGIYTRANVLTMDQALGGQADIGLYSVFISAGLVFVAGAILMWRAVNMIGPSITSGLILVMIMADLLLFGLHYNLTSHTSSIYPPTRGTEFLRSVTTHERILPLNDKWSLYETPPAVLPPNSATVYGLRDVQGYDSLFPKSYKQFSAIVQRQDPSPVENGNIIFFKAYTPRARNVAKYIVSSENVPFPELNLIYDDDVKIYENSQARSRVDVITDAPEDWPASIDWTEDGLNQVALSVKTRQPGSLILRDTLYPGWKARVNGSPADIYAHEGVFRRLRLPGGNSTVDMVFEPGCLRVGMYLSLLAVAVCMSLLVVRCATARGSSE